MATLNRTFSVKNGIDVANTIIVDSNRNLSNIVTANADTVNANTYLTVAGLNLVDHTNNAYGQANTARGTANDAYGQANAAYAQANTGQGQANAAYAQANAAYGQANAAYGQANAAYGQANDAYAAANTSGNTVRVSANAGSTLSNKQLNFNNTASIQVTVTDSGDGNANIVFNTTGAAVADAYAQANAAYLQANTAANTANGAYAQANGAYAQANGAYAQANGAYAQANGAFAQANGAYAQANGAYAQANGAYGQANLKVASITVSGNGLAVSNTTTSNNNQYTLTVNTASTTDRGTTLLVDSISSTDTGNAATANAVKWTYDFANTKLPLTGGTISGDLTVAGNLYLSQNTTLINVSTYQVEDPLIYLASNNDISDTVDIGFMGGKNTAGQYSHTGLVRHAGDQKYYLFDNLADEAHTNNAINVSSLTLATLKANLEANSITLMGNVVATQANLTLAHNQANAAYAQANAAYGDANTRVLKAGDTMTGGLTITTSGIGLSVANANVTFSLQVGTLNVTSNTVTTSSSGQVVLDKFPSSQLASAKYFVQAKSGSDYHTTEVVLVQDATNVWITEYGSIQTGPSLGSFSADISSGDVRLLFNANNNVNTIRSVRYGIIP